MFKNTNDKKPQDASRLPKHVAIIMDGNGRWAKARILPRAAGHRAGMEAIRPIVRHSSDIGINTLTLFAFSTENWMRPKAEVGLLMELLLEYFKRELDELHSNNVRIRIIGDIDGLPKAQREAVLDAQSRTLGNTGLNLNLALNYGGRAEITRAARMLCEKVVDGELLPSDITEQSVSTFLYTEGSSSEVDLLIRTSGEQRLSGFLLWQCAYAELYFTQKLWPDFDINAYTEALSAYQSRERRFGGVGR